MRSPIEILRSVNAILTNDHFRLVSGNHTETYLEKRTLHLHSLAIDEMGLLIANRFKDEPIDVVVGPAYGAIGLALVVAIHLSNLKGHEIESVYTTKTPDGNQTFEHGYDLAVTNKEVLVIEDFTTTGNSVRKVISRVEEASGHVQAISAIVNRNPKLVTSESLGHPFVPMATLEIPDYPDTNPPVCPMCLAGIPLNTVYGHPPKENSPV